MHRGISPEFDARACEREADLLADALARAWRGSATLAPQPDGRLPHELRRHFEHGMGHHLGEVRLHTAEQAAAAAARRGACAFTLGSDVFFAAGQYRPHTPAGLRLLAHELVHVVQQGAAPHMGGGPSAVRCRAPRVAQCSLSPSQIYAAVCPPGTEPKSFASSGRIGTAFGKWLGAQYMFERNPKPYGIVDFGIWWNSKSWFGGTIYDLWKYDPGVVLATTNKEFSRRGLLRTDILDAERDEVYEIKPLRSADAGPAQLAGYITSLNQTASVTSSFFGPPRPRLWRGGTWDPTRYTMIIPGVAGHRCLIHAWPDPQTQGLIVYDIVCCIPSRDEEPSESQLAPVVLLGVVSPLLKLKTQIQTEISALMPNAEPGSSFAVVASARVFETFVKRPWEIEENRRLERMYGTRLGPVHQKFLAELFILSHLIPTAPVTDALFVNSGFMSGDEILKLWGYQAAAGAVVGGCFLGVEAAAISAVAPVVAAVEGTTAAAASGTALAAGETLAVASEVPVATSPFLTGNIIVSAELAAHAVGGEAVVAGTSTVAPWMIGSSGAGAGMGTGLGVLGVFAAAIIPANAEASQPPNAPSPAQIIAADTIEFVPTQLLVPKRGVIALGAEVDFGDETFYIIGLATAQPRS
jgi:hypothetical protein